MSKPLAALAFIVAVPLIAREHRPVAFGGISDCLNKLPDSAKCAPPRRSSQESAALAGA